MHINHRHAALAIALGIALAGNAAAQTTPQPATTPTPAQQQELEAARSEMTRAAQRYAELAGKYGAKSGPVRIERREVRRPVIGVLLAGDDKPGVRIVGVTPDSAAAGAGLKGGDRILRIDGKSVDAASGEARVAQARAFLATRPDGKAPVMVMYERDGKPTTATMTPKEGNGLFVLSTEFQDIAKADGNVRLFTSADGKVGEIHANRITIDTRDPEARGRLAARAVADASRAQAATQRRAGIATLVAPEVRREIIRIDNDCKDGGCRLSVLSDALRWNGLNLASVDAGLGRYFGTDRGVLVIGTGKDLQGLQAGDVIRAINGKPVNTPREAMDVLRPLPAGGKASVDYLRDRKPATAQVSVPDVPPQLHVLTPDSTGMKIERRKVMEVEDRASPAVLPETPRPD